MSQILNVAVFIHPNSVIMSMSSVTFSLSTSNIAFSHAILFSFFFSNIATAKKGSKKWHTPFVLQRWHIYSFKQYAFHSFIPSAPLPRNGTEPPPRGRAPHFGNLCIIPTILIIFDCLIYGMFVCSICLSLSLCVLDTWTWARFCSSVAWMRTFPTFTLSSSTNTSLAAFATWWWTARWRTHTQIQARTHPYTPHTHTCTPADKWFNKSRERSQFPGAVLEMLTVTSKHFETECTVTCTVMLKFLPCCWDTAAHPDFKASPPPCTPAGLRDEGSRRKSRSTL